MRCFQFRLLQVSGKGALVANVGVPATLFVTLRDSSGNIVTMGDPSQEAAASASLQLLDPEADSPLLIVSLSYSEDDQALIGQYLPANLGVYDLQLTIGDDSAAGRSRIISA